MKSFKRVNLFTLLEFNGIKHTHPVVMKTNKLLLAGTIGLLLILLNQPAVQGQTEKPAITPGYSDASYSGLTDNEFLKNWLVAGPVKVSRTAGTPDDNTQKQFFEKDEFTTVAVNAKKSLTPVKIGDSTYSWQLVKSREPVVDFINLFGQRDYATAYALAEIKMDAPAKVLIGVGSDDGIKIFVNGKLVHNNWIGRGTVADDDLVVLDLQKGSNQVLVKVQNMSYGWSFTMRKIGKSIMNDLLVQSAGKGNLDNVKLLFEHGAEINYSNKLEQTAYQSAQLRGRDKVMDYLKEKGAKTDIPIPSFEKLVDNIFKDYKSGSTTGVSVLVSKNGEIVYEKGFGSADIGNNVPVTPDTKFKIGSITKQFTASAILKLREEGKLSLDDKLSKYIPDFPRGDEVTIRHLLTHTSGIHSYTNRTDNMAIAALPVTIAALIDTIKSSPYDFSPGEQYMYNNSGFVLLGYIVEKISGKNLADFLDESFFKPLGMSSTGIYKTQQILENEAYGYGYSDGKIEKAAYMDMSWPAGAGALYSTTKDLFKWNEALFNGKVLKEESLKDAFSKTMLNNGKTIDYGFGWAFGELRGLKLISHGGAVFGFLADLERQPDNKVNIIVLSNAAPPESGTDVPGAYSQLIAEYLLWPEMKAQASFDSQQQPDENILKSYTGRYNYGQGAVLIVTVEGNQLMAAMTGQPAFPIYSTGKDEFAWKVVEASIQFVRDEKGNVIKAIHHQGGQVIEAPKLEELVPVKVSSALFDNYTGKYQVPGGFTVVISRTGDQLFFQYMTLPPYELLPLSDTEYFSREINFKLNFQIDDTGKADAIKLIVDGAEMEAKRIPE